MGVRDAVMDAWHNMMDAWHNTMMGAWHNMMDAWLNMMDAWLSTMIWMHTNRSPLFVGLQDAV